MCMYVCVYVYVYITVYFSLFQIYSVLITLIFSLKFCTYNFELDTNLYKYVFILFSIIA